MKLQQVDVAEALNTSIQTSCKSVVTMVDERLLAIAVPVLTKLGGKR